MVTPDRIRTHQVTECLPHGIAPIHPGETQNLSRARRDAHSIQNTPLSYPRIPRLVSKSAKSTKSTLDSQFQVNASHVQRPFSLVVPNESAEKAGPVSVARRRPEFRDEKPSEVNSSSSSEQYESSGSIPTSLKHEKSRKRDRRTSPPTDSDDEDPFHFDSLLSSSPTKKANDSPSRAFSSSLLRRASIVPVDPTAEPAPHRFSLLRERASEETIFVQEICDADGRRWSLRVPASGLPEDMVHMLEELEKLAVDLGQALPRIVVTCSAESLSIQRTERDTAVVKSSELLRPPPALGDAGTGLSLAKEKHRIIDLERGPEEPTRPSESSLAAVSSASEKSLTCIYLPELAPEFLSGSSTSPVLQPADGFHSKPTQAIQCPRQRAFFSALKEPQTTSGSIAKRLIMPHSTKAEPDSKATASEASAVPSYPATQPARPKSRTQATKSKSALPILKTNLKSSSSSPAAVAATDDRRRARWASLSKAPPLPEGLRGIASQEQQQQQPSGTPDYASHTKTNNNGAAMTIVPSGAGAGADSGASAGALQHQQHHPAAPTSSPPVSSSSSSQPAPPAPDRNENRDPSAADAQRSVSTTPAPPATGGRKLRHLFRRPPVRSASDPPLYSYSIMRPVMDGGGGGGMKRPASEVVPPPPPPREVVVERRMPRLPSARDLLRKLT